MVGPSVRLPGWIRWGAELVAAGLATVACSTGGSDKQEGTQVFRSGEVLRIIVGSSPGGGYDTQARLLQPHLEEAIEDIAGVDVTVIVQNMPGAAHRIATEHATTHHRTAHGFSSATRNCW